MKACVVEKPGNVVVKDVPYPEPGPDEVTVKVEKVGICGTDIHIFKGEFISPYPIIPGHEFSGTIYELGSDVSDWQTGERVSADPSLFCGKCKYCLTNRGNQCENWGALGNTVDGSMAEFVRVPAQNLVKMPDPMSYAEGAFIEPMACVVHAMNRLQVQAGDRVLLFGAGAMGQQLVQAVSQTGASELSVVDLAQKKLDHALKKGATRGILSKEIDQVLTGKYDRSFDIVIDATGIPAVIQQAFRYMGPTAKYLQFGVTPTDAKVEVNSFDLYNKDWTILGSMAINHTFLPAFEWIKSGRMDVNPLITRTIPLEELPEFFHSPPNNDDFKVQVQI